MRGAFVLVVRVGSAFGLVAVATYYLLASIPFSYYHFLQFPHFSWQPLFIRLHPIVLLGAVAGLLMTVGAAPACLRRWVRYVATAAGTAAACMGIVVFVPMVLSYELAAVLAFVPLVLLAAGSALALTTARGLDTGASRPPVDAATRAWTAALAGTISAGTYLSSAYLAGAVIGGRPSEVAFAAVMSLAGHIGFFMLAGLLVSLLDAIAARRGWSTWVGRAVASFGVALLMALVVRRSILSALVMSDGRAMGLAVAFAIALVLAIESWMPERPLTARGRWTAGVTSAAALLLCVVVVPRFLLLADWGATLQKLVVVVAWGASLALAAMLAATRWKRRALLASMCVVLTAVGAAAATRGSQTSGASDTSPSVDLSLAVDRYATFDTSFTVLLDMFRPMLSDGDYFSLLRRVGDATDDRSLGAVPLRLVEGTPTPPASPPHIFVVVVDSLRPDYLSAYNPAVKFTPAIGAFARENIVMRHAFTPYAGTALSQPALWAGGLIPRAMYVKPFSEIDNLERLLREGGYRKYISVDEILSVILEDWQDVVRLDAHLTHPERADQAFKFELCSTVDELTGRLDRDRMDKPIFFYTQPQSLHIRLLAGDEVPSSGGARFITKPFFEPAVTTLKRVDACFGNLIQYLKRRGLYDDSIVVLTSDHGDSYGEGGRWGHAFYMAPEILRIPLIIHVPDRLRQARRWDDDALALLTDVTPTLYGLLGYSSFSHNELVGHPLLTRPDEPAPALRDMVLVEGSYSRIFGLLDGQARWLYTADVNHSREELFDMWDGRGEPMPLTKADRLPYRKRLLERLRHLNAYYGRPDED